MRSHTCTSFLRCICSITMIHKAETKSRRRNWRILIFSSCISRASAKRASWLIKGQPVACCTTFRVSLSQKTTFRLAVVRCVARRQQVSSTRYDVVANTNATAFADSSRYKFTLVRPSGPICRMYLVFGIC